MHHNPGKPARPIILIVDDDAGFRPRIAQDLRIRGFETLEAGDGLEALLQVKRARPGAVILDVTMPRLGGLEALKRIRRFDPAITAVVLLEEPDAEVEERARALGAVAVLLKPVALPRLLAALDTVPHERTASAGRVLVVDDEPEFREMLVDFLTRRGYQVGAAGDGKEALQAVSRDSPDVVLLDIEMPGMSGVEALAAIRRVAPDVKVIMISGTENREISGRSLALGAFDYIAKPVDFAYLAQSLETAAMMQRLEG